MFSWANTQARMIIGGVVSRCVLVMMLHAGAFSQNHCAELQLVFTVLVTGYTQFIMLSTVIKHYIRRREVMITNTIVFKLLASLVPRPRPLSQFSLNSGNEAMRG